MTNNKISLDNGGSFSSDVEQVLADAKAQWGEWALKTIINAMDRDVVNSMSSNFDSEEEFLQAALDLHTCNIVVG